MITTNTIRDHSFNCEYGQRMCQNAMTWGIAQKTSTIEFEVQQHSTFVGKYLRDFTICMGDKFNFIYENAG